MKFVLIYITNHTKKDAQKIARHLMEKRKIACANIFPIGGLFWWEGKIKRGKEFVLLAKTTESNFEAVKKEVERLHPYKIPCIVKIPVSSNKKYFEWLKGEVME